MKSDVELSVVQANSGAQSSLEPKPGGKQGRVRPLPVLVEKIQALAVEPLVMAMAKVHDQVDDSVFKLAEKARNNNEQSHHFDAMRNIRLNRDAAENAFRQSLETIFKNFPVKHYQSFTTPKKESTPSFACDEFSLVQNDDLEESIALESMVSKARAQNKDQLYHLNMRLDSLVADEQVDETNNPLDPAQIAEAFMLASTGLDLDIKTKLLLYKQVDLTVMSELGSVLTEANKFLIEEGVLPDLRRKIRKSKSAARAEQFSQALDAAEVGAEISDQIATEGVFDSLVGLLRNSGLSGAYGSRHFAQSVSSGFRPGATVEESVLLNTLDALQAEQLERVVDWSQVNSSALAQNKRVLSPVNVSEALMKALPKNAEGEVGSLGQSNEDVINLVALLFEFILDDYNLPASIQAVLARLQIPILKVALKDSAFFDQHNHPARKLLNELAKACIGWDENDFDNQDDLFAQVSGTVRRILNDNSGDVALYQGLYDEFKAYVDRKNHRARVMEKRTLERIYGQTKSQQVKELVKEILKDRLSREKIPAIASKLLLGGWSKVLYTACLSNGMDSKEWQHSLALADNLIWSVQAHIDELDAHKKRMDLLPELLKGLYENLTAVGSNPFELSAQFSALERAHIAAFKTEFMHFKNLKDEASAELKATERRIETMVKQVRVNQELYVDVGSKGLPAINDEILDSLAQSDIIKSESLFDEREAKEIIEAKPDASPKTAIEKQKERLHKQKSYMERLDAVALGTWFEIKLPEVGKVRCKLAEKLTDINILIFVGRFGNKVLERTPRAFLEDLAKGQAKQLDDGSLFDRAVGKIFERLKSNDESENISKTNQARQGSRVNKKPQTGATKITISEEIESILAALGEE